ncbi:hypothetical protein ACHAXT_010530 [Thalassiosira profunda]
MALLLSFSRGPSSRKRPGAPSTVGGGSDSASKRPRRLDSDATVSSRSSSLSVGSTASPPALQASATFDSASSSPGSLEGALSSLPSPRLTLTSSSNASLSSPTEHTNCIATGSLAVDHDAAVASIARHPNEYYTAVSAAKARLQVARQLAANSQRSLSCAQLECERSRQEVKQAAEFLEGVERKWGVIDVDSDASATFDESGDLDANVNQSEVNRSTDVSATSDTMERCVRRIEVSNAGEALVDGRYKLCVPSIDSNDAPTGPIYVHEEGPFAVHDECYDVVLFPKRGYGDKLRWCIGLVPCEVPGGEMGEDDDRRRMNFALAYVYYWMEVFATETNATRPPLDGEDGLSSSWGACHGARPLPMLKDVSGKRWWQFWKR